MFQPAEGAADIPMQCKLVSVRRLTHSDFKSSGQVYKQVWIQCSESVGVEPDYFQWVKMVKRSFLNDRNFVATKPQLWEKTKSIEHFRHDGGEKIGVQVQVGQEFHRQPCFLVKWRDFVVVQWEFLKWFHPTEAFLVNWSNFIVSHIEVLALSQVAEDSIRNGGDGIEIQMNLLSLSRNVMWHLSEVPCSSVEPSACCVLISAPLLICALTFSFLTLHQEQCTCNCSKTIQSQGQFIAARSQSFGVFLSRIRCN